MWAIYILDTIKRLVYYINMNDNIITKLFLSTMIVTVIVGWDVAHSPKNDIIHVVRAEQAKQEADGLEAFLDDWRASKTIPVSSPDATTNNNSTKGLEPTTQSDSPMFDSEVEAYIYKVFGEDGYNKAMLLLKGNGPDTCAENRGLSPEAINDNTTWGGVGRDWSIFQVNDVYHPVTELNLHTDWKANVRYAKRMYDNDGQTFGKRWTCGKVYAKEGLDI